MEKTTKKDSKKHEKEKINSPKSENKRDHSFGNIQNKNNNERYFTDDDKIKQNSKKSYKFAASPSFNSDDIESEWKINRKSMSSFSPRMSKRWFPWEQRLSQLDINPEILKVLRNEIEKNEELETILIYQSPGISVLRFKTSDDYIRNPVIVLPKPFSSLEMEEIKTKFEMKEVATIGVHCGLCNKVFSDAQTQFSENMKDSFRGSKFQLKSSYKCKICNETFADENLFEKHFILIHVLNKELFCSECNRMKMDSTKYRRDALNDNHDSKLQRRSININTTKDICCKLCRSYLCSGNNLQIKLIDVAVSTRSTYLSKCQFCEIIGKHKSNETCQMMEFLTTTYVFCSECHSREYDELFVKSLLNERNPSSIKEELQALKIPRRKSEIVLPMVCSRCDQIFTDKTLIIDRVEVIPYYDEEGMKKCYYQCKICKIRIHDVKSEMEEHVMNHIKKEELLCHSCKDVGKNKYKN